MAEQVTVDLTEAGKSPVVSAVEEAEQAALHISSSAASSDHASISRNVKCIIAGI